MLYDELFMNAFVAKFDELMMFMSFKLLSCWLLSCKLLKLLVVESMHTHSVGGSCPVSFCSLC